MNNMLEEAKKARDRAYAPYSKFLVGCSLKTTDGQIFTGCNIENVSYSLTLCAEATAIASMINQNKSTISELTVISSGEEICSPCGACRQRIREFSTPSTIIHMYSASGNKQSLTIEELLPISFGPSHLESSPNANK